MAARYTFVYCERSLDESSPNHFEFSITCMPECFESAVYTQLHTIDCLSTWRFLVHYNSLM